MFPVRSRTRSLYRRHPVALEAAIVIVALVVFKMWLDGALRLANGVLSAFDGPHWPFVLDGSVPYLLGVGIFATAYVELRDFSVPLAVPNFDDVPVVAVAVAAPVVLVGVTDTVAGLFGTQYSAVVQTWYGDGASLDLFVRTTLPRVLFTAVATGLVVHGIVQETFRRVLSRDRAVVATTVTALAGGIGIGARFGVVTSDLGGVAFAVLFVPSVILWGYAADAVDRTWLRCVASVPIALLGVGVVQTILIDLHGGPWLVYLGVVLAVYGLAAHAYDRTDSVWVPMLAYASFELAGRLVAFVLEAGVGS